MSWPHPHGPILLVWASDAREDQGCFRRDALFLVDPDRDVILPHALGVDTYEAGVNDVWPPLKEALGDDAMAYAEYKRVGLRGVPMVSLNVANPDS